MKRISTVLVCMIAATFLAIPTAQADDAVKAQLLTNIRSLWQAWQSNDLEPFKQWMAPNMITVTPQGPVTLSEFTNMLANKACQVKSFSIDDASALITKIDNDTYVITYKAQQDAVCNGVKSPSPVTVSEVWSEQNGKWKAYFYQETLVQAK